MSDARFILFQGTITGGDFLILPKPLASSENQAEIQACHADDDYSMAVYFNRKTRTAGASSENRAEIQASRAVNDYSVAD